MIKQLKYKLTLIFTITKEKALFMGYVFVDDIDLIAGRLYAIVHEIDNVLQDIQRAIDAWEGSIKTIEREIRPDKLFVYPILFRFNAVGKISI